MLPHAGLSNAFWAEAIATATYLHNHMVSAAIKSGKTLYQLCVVRNQTKHIRVFSSTMYYSWAIACTYQHLYDRNSMIVCDMFKIR